MYILLKYKFTTPLKIFALITCMRGCLSVNLYTSAGAHEAKDVKFPKVRVTGIWRVIETHST